MRTASWMFLGSAAMLLAGCGGEVSSAGSSPAPPLTPTPSPAPTNSNIANLTASQSFANDDSSTSVAFDLTTKTTIAGTARSTPLTVSYDASSKSYTVSSGGTAETFTTGDAVASGAGETRFQKVNGSTRDYLTLATTPYSGTTSNKYVGLGYWQRNALSGTRQDTLFDVFTYGFSTPASAAPRIGSASFAVDVFGLASTPGYEPRVFQGRGNFNVDFAAGVFSTNTYVTEAGLLSGDSIVGGGIQLQAAGNLSSSDATFSGNVLYGGQNGVIGGTLSGRFYGPGAEELGASFAGGNSSGATVTGGFTGQRDSTLPAVNLTLTNIVTAQLFYTREADLTFTSFDPGSGGTPYARTTTMGSQLNRQNSDTFSYGPGRSDLPGGSFTATSVVPSTDPNFSAYQKTFNGQDVRLELYRPGSANTELALTYASFGRWSSSAKNGVVTQADSVYFVYGLETPANLLSGKTGTGHYSGVAYGAAANETTGARYDVKGTSTFDVNFSTQSYTGALALKGTATGGAASTTDFGTFTFANTLSGTTADSQAMLMQGATNVGTINSRFYGPDGEEIGGPFTANVADPSGTGRAAIAGIAIAKRP